MEKAGKNAALTLIVKGIEFVFMVSALILIIMEREITEINQKMLQATNPLKIMIPMNIP